MGPTPKAIENIACPECGVINRVTFRGGSSQSVHYYCPTCTPHYVKLGDHLPGLPSDLTYIRENGQRLITAAYSELQEVIRQHRGAAARAERLLLEHLNVVQRREYLSARSFYVGSVFDEELRYRVSITDRGGRASAHARSTAAFVNGISRIPGVGTSIRHAAERAFDEEGGLALCLTPMGPTLPAADTALSLKLFLEVDEGRAWIKGTRIYLGAAPEQIRFTPYSERP